MKKISPIALNALKEALTQVYWYKSDLRSFLTHALSDPTILGQANWEDYKRNIVSWLIDFLACNEEIYQRDLLRLMSEVAAVEDFSHLERLEDGKVKSRAAKDAVQTLRKLVGQHEALYKDERLAEERREKAHNRILRAQGVKNRLDELAREYFSLLDSAQAQKRGYRLEKILRELFELFDLDPKASFRVVGEQIDGAFTFENTDYLLEAKWQASPVDAAELDKLTGKLSRKLENTLGLFLSINGFSPEGVQAQASGRRLVILMDGSDLMAVLEGRIDLLQLLLRKRRHAAQTGNIYLRIHDLL